MTLPSWVSNPIDENAAEQMARDIASSIEAAALEAAIENAKSQGFTITAADIKDHPKIQAEVAFHTMRRTAQIAEVADRSLNIQAAQVIEKRLYEVSEYDTAEEFFRNALADTDRSVSEISDLRFYGEEVVPYMKEQGLEGAAKVWVKGESVGKARAGKPVLKKLLAERKKAQESGDENSLLQVEQKIGTVLGEIISPEVSKSEFIARKHGAELSSGMQGFPAWNYVLPQDSSVAVLALADRSQQAFVEGALGDYAEWHLGTGSEPILKIIQNREVG